MKHKLIWRAKAPFKQFDEKISEWKKNYKNLNDDQNFENWMNILKNIFILKKDCFSRNSFSTVWYIPLSRVDFILCLTNDYIAFSVFLLNLHGVKFSKLCMLFLHLTKPQVYPGAISNYHWFQSSLNLFWRDGIIWFNSLLIMNNPLWTINRHFFAYVCTCFVFTLDMF